MIALVYFLLSIICVLIYIVIRQNWRINALEDQLEKAANQLIGTVHTYSNPPENPKVFTDGKFIYSDFAMTKIIGRCYDKTLHDFEESANFDPPLPKHKFVECLGDYDLYCDGVKARFVHLMTAKHNMIICPICGEPANFEPEEK